MAKGKKRDLIEAADLFCGAGGTSSGLVDAARALAHKVDLVAVNHWALAVRSHQANHPTARHYCQDIETLDPKRAVPSGHLDLLVASPSCTHFSMARGGKPVEDQKRSTPREILRWLKDLTVDNLLIENVREFRNWGPLIQRLGKDGRPTLDPKTGEPQMVVDPKHRGQHYRKFLGDIRSLGYQVDDQVLNAADYGDATTRHRLFIQARKRGKIGWPEVSHPKGQWRSAREIIDWSMKGESIFERKKPLAKSTLARIAAGLRKFGGDKIEPFMVMLYGTNDARSVDLPLPTVTASGQHIALCEPFILQQQSGGVPRAVSEPVPTIATKGAISLIQPFLIPFFGERDGQDPRVHSVDEPLPAVTSHGAGGLAQAFLIPLNHGKGDLRTYDLDKPMPTITGFDAMGLVQPFICKYFGTGVCKSVADPLDTITTKDRFGLVQPVSTRYGIDIRFRMLQWHELAAAMSFDKSYRFEGNRGEVVKQIGNSVPRRMARALCNTLLVG
jgi:DNA (cytosine-5)-methyltransferase 1